MASHNDTMPFFSAASLESAREETVSWPINKKNSSGKAVGDNKPHLHNLPWVQFLCLFILKVARSSLTRWDPERFQALRAEWAVSSQLGQQLLSWTAKENGLTHRSDGSGSSPVTAAAKHSVACWSQTQPAYLSTTHNDIILDRAHRHLAGRAALLTCC